MAIAPTGEFRRTALAVSAYRAGTMQRKPPAADGGVAAAAPAPEEVARDTELGSKESDDGSSAAGSTARRTSPSMSRSTAEAARPWHSGPPCSCFSAAHRRQGSRRTIEYVAMITLTSER